MSAKERSDIFSAASLFSKLSGNRKPTVAAPPVTNLPRIPRFKLLRKLGEGGMASVFLAQQESTGRQVAIKIMSRSLQNDPLWADRFLDEARRLAQLSHSNIVPVIDWGTHEGLGYIVMELLKGGDLTGRLRSIAISVGDAIEIIQQIASGLDFAGEKGYVHRDIKPDNILFREDGSPCILDFGIAKASSDTTTHSIQGLPLGTGAYMSPEQAQPAGRAVDQRSDLYSLGILFYQMLAGTRPFEYTNIEPEQAFQLYIYAHIHSEPPPLPSEYAVFQPVIDRLLAKDPEQRFSRGNELRKALTVLASQLPAHFLNSAIREIIEPSVVHSARVAVNHKRSAQRTLLAPPSIESASQPNALSSEATLFAGQPHRAKRLAVYSSAMILFSLLVGYAIFQQENITAFFTQDHTQNPETQVTAPIDAPLKAFSRVVELPPSPAQLASEKIAKLMAAITPLSELDRDDLASQQRQVAIYQKVLALDPNYAEANEGIAAIVQSQADLTKYAIAINAFAKVPERLDFIASLQPSTAAALHNAYMSALNNYNNEIQRKKDLAQLEDLIQKKIAAAYNNSDDSLGNLVNASSNLEKANRLGLDEATKSWLLAKIADRYQKIIEQDLEARDITTVKKWLANADDISLPLAQVTKLKSELAKLETSLREQEQSRQAERQKSNAAKSAASATVTIHQTPVSVTDASKASHSTAVKRQELPVSTPAASVKPPLEAIKPIATAESSVMPDSISHAPGAVPTAAPPMSPAPQMPEKKPEATAKPKVRTFGSF